MYRAFNVSLTDGTVWKDCQLWISYVMYQSAMQAKSYVGSCLLQCQCCTTACPVEASLCILVQSSSKQHISGSQCLYLYYAFKFTC